MTDHGITVENLRSLLPPILKANFKLSAIAEAASIALNQLDEDKKHASIYVRIDELSEKLLDILAYDFKIDWYSTSFSIEEKRQIIKDHWEVHQHLGTKKAIETAISAIYPNTIVKEWFEYSGKTHHFKLLIDPEHIDVDPAKHQLILNNIKYYKPLRSILEAVEYLGAAVSIDTYVTAACTGVKCNGMSFTAENY